MLIAIFGTGRNGSTLLERLLDGVPETYVHPADETFLCCFDDPARHGRYSNEPRTQGMFAFGTRIW